MPFNTMTSIANTTVGPELLVDDDTLTMARHRKITIDIVEENAGAIEVDQLAEELAARLEGFDNTTPVHYWLSILLHHLHLPKLSEMGIITYEPDHKRVMLHE